jgi:pimeloyl-ACP methyl ester carboxylesterase
MTGSMVSVGDAELCVETFGHEGDPAVLLMGGATSSMDWFEPEFCERIAAAGRYVIRFDHRDTGQSSGSPLGEPSYTGADLSADPVRLLDALGVQSAHLVGVSMGGGIAQDIAVEHPDRVLSLTLIATTAAFDRADPAPLPPPDPRLADEAPADDLDWGDQEAVVDQMVEVHRLYAGSLGEDDGLVREISRRVVERTLDVRASVTNHWLVVGGGGDGPHHTMAEIDVPTLVMHGSDDPLFPAAHGRALAAEIRGAALVPLEGMGHEVPPRSLWDVVVPAIIEHTSAVNAGG